MKNNNNQLKSTRHRTKKSLESKMLKKYNPYQKRNSVLFNIEINKLNYRNSIKNNTAEFNFNSKEFLRNFEFGVSRANILLEDSVKEQRTQFLESLKLKLFQQNLKSDSKINTRNQSFIKRKTINPDFNSHSPIKMRNSIEDYPTVKKLDFSCLNDSSKKDFLEFRLSEEEVKKNKKQKKKNHVGGIVDGYLSQMHQTYYSRYCEQAIKKSVDLISQGYQKKIQNFNEYNDQRMDLQLMLLNTPSKYFLLTILR